MTLDKTGQPAAAFWRLLSTVPDTRTAGRFAMALAGNSLYEFIYSFLCAASQKNVRFFKFFQAGCVGIWDAKASETGSEPARLGKPGVAVATQENLGAAGAKSQEGGLCSDS